MKDCDAFALTLPVERYTGAHEFTREMESLLLRQWHFVCLESDIPTAGQTVARTLLGKPILVRRSADGILRGFFNACRHRGGILARDGVLNCKSLRCLYHGWTYNDEGQLCKLPQFADDDAIASLPLDQYSLYPIQVACWAGMIFVSLVADSDALGSMLGDLPQLLSSFDASSLRTLGRRQFRFECNWKLYVENWLESYHLPWIHPGLVKDVNVSEYEVTLHNQVVQHRSRKRSEKSIYDGAWLWLAPNTAWNFYSDGVSIEQMHPLDEKRTEVTYTFCFKPDAPPDSTARSMEMCEQVTQEDGLACEWVYRNMRAGSFRRGPLSPRHESAIRLFHEYLEKRVQYTQDHPVSEVRS